MQIINELNEYISKFDPEWINRLKPASEEDLKLLKKYTFMDREGLEFPEEFVEFVRYAGEDDGGLLTAYLGGVFSIKRLVNLYKYDFEACPEEINPFEFEFFMDNMGMSYYIFFSKNNVIYYTDSGGELDRDYNETDVRSSSFKNFLFRCAILSYEEKLYKNCVYFSSSINSMEKSAYKRKDDTLESLARELIREYDLESAWFNDEYFLYAHNKEISIIFCKGLAIYGYVMGNDSQQTEKIIKFILPMIGGSVMPLSHTMGKLSVFEK